MVGPRVFVVDSRRAAAHASSGATTRAATDRRVTLRATAGSATRADATATVRSAAGTRRNARLHPHAAGAATVPLSTTGATAVATEARSDA